MTATRKTPWLLFIFLVLFAAAASCGATWLFINKYEAHSDSTANVEVPAARAPLLVTIAPMTVNIQNERNEQSLLYVGFALEVGNDTTQKFFQQYMPQVRSRLLTLLGGQNSDLLVNARGKQNLAANILASLKQPLAPQQPDLSVLNVLYTDFIVQ